MGNVLRFKRDTTEKEVEIKSYQPIISLGLLQKIIVSDLTFIERRCIDLILLYEMNIRGCYGSHDIAMDHFRNFIYSTRSSIIQAIKNLEQRKIIFVERKKGAINVYSINLNMDEWLKPNQLEREV